MSFWNLATVFEAKAHYPIKCSWEGQVKIGVCLFDGPFSSSPLLGLILILEALRPGTHEMQEGQPAPRMELGGWGWTGS